MADLDVSYSGITKMLDDLGPEETLQQLQQEWSLRLTRLEIAEKDLDRAKNLESSARTGLANFATAIVRRKIGSPEIIDDPTYGSMVKMTSVNGSQVITIRVNANTTRATYELSTAFNLTKKEVSNG